MTQEQKQTSLFDGLKELKEGERQSATITDIISGRQQDFRTDAYFAAMKDSTPEEVEQFKSASAVKVVASNGAELILSLPKNNIVSGKSNLYAFKKTYGKYPEVGLPINTKLDENGFWRVVLERA